MPQLKFNHRKRPGDGVAATARKALWRRVAAVACVVAIAMSCLTAAVVYADGTGPSVTEDPIGAILHGWQNALGIEPLDAGDTDSVADAQTLGAWQDYMDASVQTQGTANVGRIWTDKSVSTSNIPLEPNGGTINKASSSDFLVALSALSSTSNKVTYTDKPLDIVLVLDRSGSMTQGGNFSDSQIYLPTYDAPQTPNRWGYNSYYALVDNRYQQIERVQTGGSGWNPVYAWQLNGETVVPKTNPDDSDGITFYERSGRYKMDALKEAADNFILSTAEMNADIPDDQPKHQISVVSFAGEYYGTDVSTDAGLTDCEGAGAADLINAVNGLEANGGTRSDQGLARAQSILNASARRDTAQQVVVFFTDGTPGMSGWDEDVADGAISTAREMKANGALVYTIGIFENADPSDDPTNRNTSDENRYMHAVSSNYPSAQGSGRNELGQRAPETTGDDSYYKAARDAAGLNNVFDQIAQDMVPSSVGVPTEVSSGFDMAHDGYITFTDTLGQYMQIDPAQGLTIVYANEQTPVALADADGVMQYGNITMPDKAVMGNFTDDAGDHSNLNQIKLTITQSADYSVQGDTVTLQIPASLIPLLHYSVNTEDGTTTVTTDDNDTFPIRALYGVKLVDNMDELMVEQLSDPDSALSRYVAQDGNASADGTQAYFYSNDWQRPVAGGTTATGSTTASFNPSQNNAFYYFQEDTPVYTDEDCTTPATEADLQGDGNLYYKFTYDVAGADGEGWEAVAVPKGNFWDHPNYYGINNRYQPSENADIETGQLYIRDEMPRLSRAKDFDTAKADGANLTATATEALQPSWTDNSNAQTINVALGNNGRLTYEMPGSLSISKEVVTPQGFPQNDVTYHEGVDFTFKIHVDGANGTHTAAVIEDGQTTPVEIVFANGDATYELHDGQELIIYGLDNGARYAVTETAQDGYTTTQAGDTGTIVASETQHAAFTNTYSITTPATVTGEADLVGSKVIDGRAWENGESYTFVLAALNNGPLPLDDEGNPVTTVTVNGADGAGEDPQAFHFGDIVFDTPGEYRYTIYEDDAQSTIGAGVTTSRARYRVTITVTDNHDGTLGAETSIQQTVNDQGTTLNPWGEPGDADFVNFYQVGETTATIQAVKDIDDQVGSSHPIDNDDYQFILQPTGNNAAATPMPANAEGEGADRTAKMTNTGETAMFGVTIDNDDFPEGQNSVEFWYTLVEDDAYNVIPGMEYTDAVYYVKLTATRATDDDGAAIIETQVEYFTDADGTQPATDNQALFTNVYDPDDVTTTESGETSIHGTKTVDGRDWNGDSYTFEITEAEGHEGQDGVTMPADRTATVSDDVEGEPKVEDTAYSFSFDGITFSKAGTYYFTITETGAFGTDNGMTYDTHETNVVVTVGIDAENGKLEITDITYDNEGVPGASDEQAEYTNVYRASVDFGEGTTGGIQIVKSLTGRSLRTGEFSFTVKGIEGTGTTADEANALLATSDRLFNNDADGTMQLFQGDGFNFDQDDAGKTFSFVVDELSTAEEIEAAGSMQTIRPNVAYDQTSYRVDLTIVDNGDGSMRVDTAIAPCNAAGEVTGDQVYTGSSDAEDYAIPTVTFNNSYTPDAATFDTSAGAILNKVIDGRAWINADEFTFTIAADEALGGNLAGEAMPSPATVTLSGDDHANTLSDESVPFGFGKLTFSKPGTYQYVVTEDKAGQTESGLTYSDNTAVLKFVVEDDPDTGDLIIVNSDTVTNGTFTNTYEASVNYNTVGGLNIKKTLENHALAADQFTFVAQEIDENGDAVGEPIEWKNPAPTSGASIAQWNPIKDGIPFTQDEAGRTIRFTVSEQEAGADGYTYDGTDYTVEITPIDNHDGTMSVHTKVTQDGVEEPIFDKTTSDDAPEAVVLPFVNTYGDDATTGDVAADVEATKKLTGRPMDADEFSFEIVTRDADPDDGIDCTPTTVATGTNAAADNGVAGDVTFTDGDGNDMTYTIEKLEQAVADGYATKGDDGNGNAVWTLSYTAQENTSALPAKVTPVDGKTSFDFTVTVADQGGGTLKATVELPQDGIAFENTYTPDPVVVGPSGEAAITVQKTFTGRPNNEWLDTDSFTFTIEAVTEDAPTPDPATVEVTNKDTAVGGVSGAYTDIFGDIEFTKAMLGNDMEKTFEYTITETAPAEGNGITVDTHATTVKVTITDNEDGTLSAKVAYDNGKATTEADQAVTDAAAFTNTYNAGSGELDGATYLKASKTLTNREWQTGEQVDLVLRGSADTPHPDGATDTERGWEYRVAVSQNGEISFPSIAYSVDDLDGAASKEFAYAITEDASSHTIKDGDEADIEQIHQGMDYSQARYLVHVTVSDNNNGALDVSSSMVQMLDDDGNLVNGEEGNPATVAAFTNGFSADEVALPLELVKYYDDATGAHPIANNMFSFRVRPVGDEAATAPMDDSRVQGTGADRYIDAGVRVVPGETPDARFGTARFQFDGQNHTFYYEVTENMPAGANEGNGYKVDGVTYDPTTFTVKVEVAYDADAQKSSAEMSIYKGTYDEVSKATEDELAGMKVDGIAFNNSYGTGGTTVDTGEATTSATFYKVIDGRDWLGTDSFQFTITPNDGAPAFEGADPDSGVKSVDVTADNTKVDTIDGEQVYGRSFDFGSVSFTDEDMDGATVVGGKLTKVFTYTVAEVEPAEDKIPGMSYDGHKATLQITVIDNGDGTMTATPQVLDGTFTNHYSTSVDYSAVGGFQITKTLTGHAMTAGQFTFKIDPQDSANTTTSEVQQKFGISGDYRELPSPAAEDGTKAFVTSLPYNDNPVTFTQEDAGKTYAFDVSESKGGGDGYTNDNSIYHVEVAVTHDASTATLTVTTTVTKDGQQVDQTVVTSGTTEPAIASVDFSNSYSASTDEEDGGAAATVSTTKKLENRPLEDGEFEFQVAYARGDKAVVKDSVTNAADGTVDFGSFEYTTETLADMVTAGYATKTVDPGTGNATWTIQYTASEVTDGLPAEGVTPAETSFDFYVTVVDNGDGSLTATAKLPENHVFTNTYSSTGEDGNPVSVTPAGNKVFAHAQGLEPNLNELAGKFTFTLEAVTDGAPMPEGDGNVTTNDAQGNVKFGAIEFSLDDLNAALAAQEGANAEDGVDTLALDGQPREFTFTYQVTETGGVDYVENDATTVREFSYTVHDDGKGSLTVTANPAQGPLFTFTNTYTVDPEPSSPTGEGQLSISKTLNGRDMDAGEFTFELAPVGDAPMPDGLTALPGTNAAAGDGKAGAVTFGEITFDTPGVYQYTLREIPGATNVGIDYDADTYTVTATVKDSGTGTLGVAWTVNGTDAKDVAFENTYTADPTSISFGASKLLAGRDLTEGEFTFQVTNEAGDELYATATNDAAGTVNFDPIALKQAGTYHMWISEVLPEDDDPATTGIQSQNVTYDERRYEIVVTVEDSKKGYLEITDINEVAGAPVFANTYTEPEQPEVPGEPGGANGNGGDKLVQTGDYTMAIVAGVAVAGAALVAGGYAVSKKRGE